MRKILLIIILLSLSFRLTPSQGNDDPAKIEAKRATLISYVLRTNLARHHFTKKQFDDNLSRAAFGLYLKVIDPQKRYLLKEDVELLKGYMDRMDDEIMNSSVHLPEIAGGILAKRTHEAELIIREALSENPDFSSDETIETDPEKIDFCGTADELKERWRKALKYQVLYRYLSMVEDEGKARTSETEHDLKDKSAKADKQKKEPGEILTAARKKILKNYETTFQRGHQENPRERYDIYFESIARSFDPHTNFMPPVDKEDFDIGMKGSLEGIGATLKEDEGYVKIVSIVPGGPAYRQGELQPEDVILKVGEGSGEPIDITDLILRDAIKIIRGKKGTEVTLTVKKPSGMLSKITIVRDVVQLEEGFAKGTILKDEKTGRSYGYLKIPTFYRDFESTRFGGGGRNVTSDVRKELKSFESEKISGLILDLRNNGGGALTDAVRIAGLFLKGGPVVQVKTSDEKVSVMYDDDPTIAYSGPVTVLVNKFSASASEILAGALQDYGRAVIIGGEHT
ncbi:MAG: PDZ domain-containing protein, partial [Nitrospirae bacterium]|nr:PDZ domain-containing protein [Nitrospirota bacterium]